MSGEARVFSREQKVAQSQAKYSQHFFRRVPVAPVSYEPDDGELLPTPKKIGRVEVLLADAEKISIKTEGPKLVTYEADERPTVLFKGSLAVTEIPDETPEAEPTLEEGVTVDSTPVADDAEVDEGAHEPSANRAEASVQHLHITHRRGRGHLHEYSEKQKREREPLENLEGVIAPERARIVNRNPASPTLMVLAPKEAESSRLAPVSIVVSALVASVVVVGLLGFYGRVVVDGTSVVDQYGFTVKELVELLKLQVTALLVHSF